MLHYFVANNLSTTVVRMWLKDESMASYGHGAKKIWYATMKLWLATLVLNQKCLCNDVGVGTFVYEVL